MDDGCPIKEDGEPFLVLLIFTNAIATCQRSYDEKNVLNVTVSYVIYLAE